MRSFFNDAYAILFAVFFIEADVLGTCLNCLDFVEAIQMSTHNMFL